MSANDKFEQWAILEIMGHQRYAGLVSEQALGGASFVRIDVPACDDKPAFTKLFGAGSIYCISPVAEEIAREMASKLRQVPVQSYDFPESVRRLMEAKTLFEGDPIDSDYEDSEV